MFGVKYFFLNFTQVNVTGSYPPVNMNNQQYNPYEDVKINLDQNHQLIIRSQIVLVSVIVSAYPPLRLVSITLILRIKYNR